MIKKAPVSTIMTQNVITLNKDDDLEIAEGLFKLYKIRHIPVVFGNAVIGMLSHTDVHRINLVNFLEEEEGGTEDYIVYNRFKIEQVMTKKVVSIRSSTTIKEAAEILAHNEFHALPVIDNNRLIGILTTTDLLNYLVKQF